MAYHLAREMGAAAVIRVGGPNSGHTIVVPGQKPFVFRHLPTAALLPKVHCIIGPGSYLDVDVLLKEINVANLPANRISIDPHAFIIEDRDRRAEEQSKLRNIGSTLSGTGAAVQRRIGRDGTATSAKDSSLLGPYVGPTAPFLRELLDRKERVIIEGTQGFGLSVVHSPYYPMTTSRDTTAASFISEAGLSPLDVDDIVLVLRAFPIRVPGNSGPLPDEIDWETIRAESGDPSPIVELTSVTRRIRRVARFHPEIVREAIRINQPTRIVLNHLDYIDPTVRDLTVATPKVIKWVEIILSKIQRDIGYFGFSPSVLVSKETAIPSNRKANKKLQVV